ncbi:ArsC family reductase [Vibrio parahaemolyticus]|uniref:ArsC family reductase n=1 Tax=unclassified Vibrio TaxID=2614977 RepID=UPI00222FC3F4|nr:ArsC family reductase [Vibrio sp. STUT-A11]WMN86634.1 ArsC family reductase [Vibrio parahaemolyticus]BDR12723.1 arsenate reductase [Vibrio sp. STUT-A11]
MTITMFGIPNCDTIKKAKKWLEAEDIAYEFHDYRKQGVDEALVTEFCDALGWEIVLNKRGTTFRQLTQEQKDSLNEENAIKLLVENPAMIKRPILKVDDQLHIGFKADQYTTIFNS